MSERKGLLSGRSRPASRGFTIVEFVISLVLVAITLSLAIPALQQFAANNQVIAANNTIVTGLNMARSAAITTGEDITICPSQNGSECAEDAWDNGWIVFNDENGNGDADEAEIIRVVTIESDLSASGFGESIVFESDGTTDMDANATITNCHSARSSSCMQVMVNQFGVIESHKQVLGTEEETEEEGS